MRVNIKRKELEADAGKRKKIIVDANFGPKPPATKPPPLQSPRSSTATPKTLPDSARVSASAAPPKAKRRNKDEWPASDNEEEVDPDDAVAKICEDMLRKSRKIK